MDAAESTLALHELKSRYASLVDARFRRGAVVGRARLDAVAGAAAALFTEDGVWDGGPALGVARGREAIAARLAEPTLVFSRHLFVQPRLAVDGDRASGPGDLSRDGQRLPVEAGGAGKPGADGGGHGGRAMDPRRGDAIAARQLGGDLGLEAGGREQVPGLDRAPRHGA